MFIKIKVKFYYCALASELEELGKVEQMPKLEGKRMTMFIAPKTKENKYIGDLKSNIKILNAACCRKQTLKQSGLKLA